MKKFLRMVSVFALAGATLAYTGCTDYSEDIDKVNDRIDNLSGTDLKSIGEQITALKTSISSLEAAKTTTEDAIKALQTTVSDLEKKNVALTTDNENLKTNVSSLQTKLTSLETDAKANAVEIASIKADIAANKKSIEANEESIAANKTDIAANKNLINGLTSKVAGIETSINSLIEQIKSLATKTYVDDEIAKLRNELAALDTEIDSKLDAADTAKLNATAKKYADAVKAYANETFATKDSLKKATDAIAALNSWMKIAESKFSTSGEGLLEALKKIEDAKTAADKAKEDAADALGKIAEINEALESYAKKSDLKTASEALQENIDAAVTTLNAAIKAAVDSAYADHKEDSAAIAGIKKQIAEFVTKFAAINTSLEGIDGKIDGIDDKIDGIDGKIDSINTAISAKVDSINTAIKASITALDSKFATGTALADSIKNVTDKIAAAGTKISAVEANIIALQAGVDTLDKSVNALILKACQNGGSISNAISTQIKDSLEIIRKEISTKVSSLESKFSGLEKGLNNAVYIAYGGVDYQQLRGLTFIPDAITEGGAEVVRYTRVEYFPITLEKAAANYESGNIKADKEAGFNYKTAAAKSSYFPTDTLSYKMNPSSAVVTKDNKLSIEVRPVDVVSRSGNQPLFSGSAKFFSADNGILKVGLTLSDTEKTIDDAKAQLFALSVAVKSSEKGDTTITSAYKMLNFSVVDTFNLFSKDGAGEKALKTTFADALDADALEYAINYKDGGNITDSLVTKFGNATASTVYDFKANKWNLKYEFALVNYTNSGISQSDLVTIDETTGKVTPKANSVLRIDAKPIVRVTLKDATNDKIVAIGFLRLKLAPTTYFVRDIVELSHIIKNCDAVADTIKVDDTFREAAGITDKKNNKEFNDAFALHTLDSKVVIYDSNDTTFSQAAAYGELKVEEKNNADTNRDSLIVSYDAKTLAKIYAEKNHSKKFFVRYVAKDHKTTAIANINAKEGLYIPIKVTVSRTGKGTLSGKISNLWFDNQTSTKLNVGVPEVKDTIYTTQVSSEWTKDLYTLWNNGEVTVTIGDESKSYGKSTSDYTKTLFFFAPEQPKIGDYYLVVKTSTAPRYDGEAASPVIKYNSQLTSYGDTAIVAYDADGNTISRNVYALKDPSSISLTDTQLRDSLLTQLGGGTWNEITLANTKVAKEILNHSASTAPEFYVNVAYQVKENCFAAQLTNPVSKYYFLRPINMVSNGSKTFTDGKNADAVESNVNLLDILTFSDWRGEAFKSGDNYSNVGYFHYYNISSINVLTDEATTDLSGHDIDKDLLKTVYPTIALKYRNGDHEVTGPQTITYAATGEEANEANSKFSYDNLVKDFGYIRYTNGGINVEEEFNVRIPVEITYAFGTIKTYVTITVKPTEIGK